MNTLTTKQIETLKGFVWTDVGVDNSVKRISNLDFDTFTYLTGYDIKLLSDSISLPVSSRIDYLKSGVYNNGEKYFLYYCVFVDGVEWASGNFAMYDNDVLELFTPAADAATPATPEGEPLEQLKTALTACLNNPEINVDSIVELLDNDFKQIPDKIRENYSDNLEVSDIGDCLRYDVAQDWIAESPSDAYDTAIEKMDSYEIKDKIIDYLSNNL